MDGGVLSKWEADAMTAINWRDLSNGVSKAEERRMERLERKKERLESEYDSPMDY